MRELFAGIFAKVEDEILERAWALMEKLRATKPDGATARKLGTLEAVLPRSEDRARRDS